MSDPGNEPGFLARWSRRKAASQPEAPAPELPAIETLGPASDFAAFLQKGVTAELQRQALSVAWRSDPVIAGFRGMADYDWDFNAPGYGKLRATDDVAKLLRAVLSPPLPEDEPSTPQAPGAAAETPVMVGRDPTIHDVPIEPAFVTVCAAAPDGPEPGALPEPDPVPRRHGSALPT